MRYSKYSIFFGLIIIFFSIITAVLPGQEFYYEPDRFIGSEGARFPQAASIGDKIVVAYQEIQYEEETDSGTNYITILTSDTGRTWTERRRVLGGFPFVGEPAPVFSLALDDNGRIHIAVVSSKESFILAYSDDDGRTFTSQKGFTEQEIAVAPRLFHKNDGGLLLFISQEIEESLSSFYSISDNGESWTALKALETSQELRYNFLPSHASFQGKEYVAFQSFVPGASRYQIYLKWSDDGGANWSDAVWLTDFSEAANGENIIAEDYDNELPFIADIGDRLALSWERNLGREPKKVFYLELNENGEKLIAPEQVNSALYTGNSPRIVQHSGEVYVLWFDSRGLTERIYLSGKEGPVWTERRMSDLEGRSNFPTTVMKEGRIHIFWQNRQGESFHVAYLEPDTSVESPRLFPGNFARNTRSAQKFAQIRWAEVRDPSGIAGYSYVWNRQEESSVPRKRILSRDTRQISLSAEEDGEWFFHLAAQDFAGNWSEPSTISYYRDTTPPGTVSFVRPERDEDGYLTSNSFRIRWKPPGGDVVAGYAYDFRYLADARADLEETETEDIVAELPQTVVTEEPLFNRQNNDNGLWALSVAAVDSVGNVGEANTIFLRLNKYIPVTYISSIDTELDYLGRINFSITGRGFTANGIISQVILDKDGSQPYDYIFERRDDAYRVLSDRSIIGPAIENIEEGSYRVGLLHPERGLYFAPQRLALESTGTIKYGDYTIRYAPDFAYKSPGLFTLELGSLLFYIIMAFLIMMVLFASGRIIVLVREGQMLKMEVKAIVAGDRLPLEKKQEKIKEMRKRGIGLRVKFTLLVTTLVVGIVLLVAFPLGLFMIETQQNTLGNGLDKRAEVMLEGLASGAREYLPQADRNRIELAALTNQISAMDEAVFTTITGQGFEDKTAYDYIWATNDPEIVDPEVTGETEEDFTGIEKISTDVYIQGISRIQDSVSEKVDELKARINQEAQEALGSLPQDLKSLQERGIELALSAEEEAQQELQQVQESISVLSSRIRRILSEVGAITGSMPRYNVDELGEESQTYVFYKPIVYLGDEFNRMYYRGLIRLGISTENIIGEISESRRSLIIRTGIITLIAIGVGIAGALILASITLIPINRLVRGVEVIRDTEDKEKLENHIINVKTRDELSLLANTVNQMTHGLVEAAKANKDLIVGKEVQKMFIPLEKDNSGRKLTTGKLDEENIEFFGYYEGAKGVSGDYFDFNKLDSNRYAIIKCDVAGKGVPAALIMVEVATIFIDHFKDWQRGNNKVNLEPLVYRVNDLLEERGFKGRFAAFTVCLLDAENGTCYLCNAGDNIVHLFDNSEGRALRRELPEAPAAGVFPSMLVEMQSGFKQVKMTLESGDMLSLFTDGLEEAKRVLRDKDFQAKPVTKEEAEKGLLPEEFNENVGDEEFGIDRIHAIIDAVIFKRSYTLNRVRNPIENEELVFDFSNCSGTAEEVVLALVSVEKVFRIYPDPKAGPEDRVQVDTKINAFLKEHFLQYSGYFHHPIDSEEESEYEYFSHIKEDEQYDDLTILNIRKK